LYRALFILLIMLISFGARAQQKLDIRVGNTGTGKPLLEYFNSVEKDGQLKFFYLESWLQHFMLRSEHEGKALNEVLTMLLSGSDISFAFFYDYAVIFYKDPSADSRREDFIRSANGRQLKVDKVTMGDVSQYIPGAKVVLEGRISDQRTGSPLSDALININGTELQSSTGESGDFKFILPAGEYAVSVKHFNYDERIIDLAIYRSGRLDLNLSEAPITLDEVVISDQGITNTRIGQTTIKMTDLKRTPSFLGITDIIKQIQNQPGVTTVSEASSGFNVRGGSTDQNLVLFDGVPVLNTSHALGFFTAFNAESIGQASFYKGGIPADFGGRVSSVLNLMTRDGDYTRWKGGGGIGLISSDLSVGGPIKRDTSSLLVSLRGSYADWALDLIKTRFQDFTNGSIFFYDASVKYSHKLGDEKKLTIAAYTSSDEFELANDTINQWRNIALSMRFDDVIRKNLSYSAGFYFGRYAFQLEEKELPTAFNLNYQLSFPALKFDFNRDGVLHKNSFGFHTTFYYFSPGEMKPTAVLSNKAAISMPHEKSVETALYFSDNFQWTNRIHVEAGLRLSLYTRLGPATVYKYKTNEPLEPRNTTDSVQYDSWDFIKSYLGPEPRLSLRYVLDQHSSLKFGYNRLYQYIHLVSNTASVTPVDIWQMSSQYFKPQRSDQISLGYFKDFSGKRNEYEISVEVFYKHIKNILDFKDGASLILNRQLETALLNGIGKAYGAEISLDKLKGRLTANLNYTYSRSLRRIESDFQTINEGQWYPSNFDQPHIGNINWRYAIHQKLFFTGVFTYRTGRPISLPLRSYPVDHQLVSDFPERNNFRVVDYHRLDVALVIEGSHRKKKYWEGSWVISIYNVYGRKNPYSVFFSNAGGGVLKPYQLSLVGTVVPSLTYRFKF
jgi:hypothetical protein